MRFYRTTLLILAVCLALSACKKKDETPPAPAPEVSTAPTTVETTPAVAVFKVDTVDLGNAIGPDKKVTAPATTFGPKDTIYASIATEGAAPSVKLHAKWTFGDTGTVVKEEDLNIAPTGPAVNEFHISKKTPWPAGKYHVEISADGVSAATKDFEITK